MPTPATQDEVLKMARDEAEQRRLRDAGLGGIGSKTVTPAPALAPSANAYVAPEIPQITSFSTPPPIEPAPTLGDGQVSAANELLGNAAHDASLGTVAGDPTVSPAVAATSQAADQTNAAIQAKAEPTGAAFAEAVFGDPKPAQSQAPVDPNDPYAADRNKMEKDGVKAIDESYKIEMGAATRDDRHLNPETGAMDPGGNGILDAEEMAAHVSSIESAWREADEGIKARIALDYKNNLEKLQEEQHRIKAQYSAMVDEVANTYINPAELWDKGGFGARIGIPGAAFLDTFFAMKGWNVPSFSAQWDKAVEGNVIAQTSKLAQKTGKLAGFEKLWNMAGQIATNEKEQIAYTSDLLKAATMGQYVHQLAPFKSLAAAADAQAMKADAMRKIGKDMMNTFSVMEQNAMKRKAQIDADALAKAKLELERSKVKHRQMAREGGAAGYADLTKKQGDHTLAKRNFVRGLTADAVTPEIADAYANTFQGLPPGDKEAMLNRLVGGKESKNSDWTPVYHLVDGKREVIAMYNSKAETDKVKGESIAKLQNYYKVAETLSEINEAYAAVVAEAPDDVKGSFGVGNAMNEWVQARIGDPNEPRSTAQQRLLGLISTESLRKLHELSGGAVTFDEAKRFEQLFPTGAFTKDGRLKNNLTAQMSIINDITRKEVDAIGQATGSIFPVFDKEDPRFIKTSPQIQGAMIFAKSYGGERIATGGDNQTGANTAVAMSQKQVEEDPNNSPYEVGFTMQGGLKKSFVIRPVVNEALAKALQGMPTADMTPKHQHALRISKKIAAQAGDLVTRAWQEDKDSWRGVKDLMGKTIDNAQALRKALPADFHYKIDYAVAQLKTLQFQASEQEASMRVKPPRPAGLTPPETFGVFGQDPYDHTKANEGPSLEVRKAITRDYKAIMENLYAVPNQENP